MSLVVPLNEVFSKEIGLLAKHHTWERIEIKFLAEIINGFAFKSNLFSKDEGFPIIRIRDLSNGKSETYYTGHYSEEYVVSPGDLLIGMDGNFICCEWKGREGLLNQRVCKIIANEEYLIKKFLLYGINGYLSAIQKATSSVTVAHLSSLDIARIPFPLPPLNEQRRIVAKLEKLLAKVDTCKERLDKIPAILKRFRQSVLSAACSGRLTADWRENNPDVESAEELLKRIQEERLKKYEEESARAKLEGRRKPKKPKEFQLLSETPSIDIPKSWEVAYPEDLCSSKNYSIGIGPFGSNLKVSDYKNDGVPLIFVRHIRSGNFAGLDPKYVTPEKAQELLPHMAEALDLLITKMGEPPGDCEIYPDGRPNGIISSDCLKFRIWETDLERVFFKHCINSFIIKDQLGLITKGVAQQKISVERFKSILFPVPPLAEQQEIVNRVETLFKTAEQIEQRYQKARTYIDQLTQSILAKAFRGELVPQDPNDEPASVLLERIRAERENRENVAKTAKKPAANKKQRSKKAQPQLEPKPPLEPTPPLEPIQLELPLFE